MGNGHRVDPSVGGFISILIIFFFFKLINLFVECLSAFVISAYVIVGFGQLGYKGQGGPSNHTMKADLR